MAIRHSRKITCRREHRCPTFQSMITWIRLWCGWGPLSRWAGSHSQKLGLWDMQKEFNIIKCSSKRSNTVNSLLWLQNLSYSKRHLMLQRLFHNNHHRKSNSTACHSLKLEHWSMLQMSLYQLQISKILIQGCKRNDFYD